MSDALSAGAVPISDADVEFPATPEVDTERGVAWCLSGGGYRAMLFHLGGLLRLNELGLLTTLTRVSSVSGGSITAGVLGSRWSQLRFDTNRVATNLPELVVTPVLDFARHTIDVRSVLGGLVTPGRSISDRVASAYDRRLFDGATLQDLPADGAGPRFVINATSAQTGKLFRFSRPYAGDYTVGLWRSPTIRLADAVAASSAFPPVLSPHVFRPTGDFDAKTIGTNTDAAYRERVVLSDGGVYDNLGLETAWKRAERLYVSDGGGRFDAATRPRRDWALHSVRVGQIVDSQVRALRKRQLIDGFTSGVRSGAYWGVSSDVASYQLDDPLEFRPRDRRHPADVPTRLAKLGDDARRDLVHWGYVIADTALRRWVLPSTTPRPATLPDV